MLRAANLRRRESMSKEKSKNGMRPFRSLRLNVPLPTLSLPQSWSLRDNVPMWDQASMARQFRHWDVQHQLLLVLKKASLDRVLQHNLHDHPHRHQLKKLHVPRLLYSVRLHHLNHQVRLLRNLEQQNLLHRLSWNEESPLKMI